MSAAIIPRSAARSHRSIVRRGNAPESGGLSILLLPILHFKRTTERLPVKQDHPLPVWRPLQVPRLELLWKTRAPSVTGVSTTWVRHSRAGTPTHSATSVSRSSSSPPPRCSPSASGSTTHSSLHRYTLWLPHATASLPARPGSGFHRAATTFCSWSSTLLSRGARLLSVGRVVPDGDVDAAPGPVTRLPFCPWCVGKSYSRTAVGADPDRTSRRVPDVLNAT